MVEALLISAGASVAVLGFIGLVSVWHSPQSAIARVLAPSGWRLQPSRSNRALTALFFVLFGSYLALSVAGFERAGYFVLGALYPVLGYIIFRVRSRH